MNLARKWQIVCWLTGWVGLGMFGYSLAQQTVLQADINGAMAVISESLASTGAVVGETSQTLDPLQATTLSLAEIELQEQATADSLASMNRRLEAVAKSETGIIEGLKELNVATVIVENKLQAMGGVTGDLLQSGKTSGTQAATVADQVTELNRLTAETIAELKKLNDKLAPLRLLP